MLPNKKSKHIGIDARFYGPIGKGLGRYTKEVVDRLLEIDRENNYVIFFRPENYDEFKADSKRVKKVMVKIGWYGWAEQIIFPFYIWRQHLDFIHFPHFNVPIFCPNKFVVTIHDLILLKFPTKRATTLGPFLYLVKNFFYKAVITLAVWRASRVIAVSEFTKNDLIKQFKIKSEKVIVTYEGVTDLTYQPSLPLEKSQFGQSVTDKNLLLGYNIATPFLLYVGNAYPHKNLEGLVNVFKKIKKSLEIKSPTGDLISSPKNLQLVLVGKEDYFYKRLKDYAKKFNLWQDNKVGSAVVFPGYVPDQQLKILYQQAAAYVFPSYYEGFGLPPLEAMANGCPVISSNQTSLPEVLGNAALYFNPNDQKEMQNKIQSVISDKNLRQELINRGLEQVKKYSWQECAKKTLLVYQQIFS